MIGIVRSDDMNRIVRDHYPASQLPDDLRRELGDATSVRLTIELEEPQGHPAAAILERARQLRETGRAKPVTSAEAVNRIRKLRDEWDA
jgi:hypothetical protein